MSQKPPQSSRMEGKWICLVMFLSLLCICSILQQHWYGDIWEHAAVVRSLAERPWSPEHPLLNVDASHAFFSPYHLFLGLISRATGLAHIGLFQVMTFVNFAGFLFGFHRFVSAISAHRDAAFWALLVTLFFWLVPYSFSGYFHLTGVVAFSALPSTFATGLSLYLLAKYLKHGPAISAALLLALSLASLLVLLVHPFTAVVLFTGYIAISIHQFQPDQLKRLSLTAVLIIGFPLLLAGLWPYYPFWDLLLHHSSSFHASNRQTYSRLLLFLIPLIIMIPTLMQRFRRRWNDVLVWFFFGLSILYCFGLIAGQYSFGRMGSYMALTAQIATGIFLAERRLSFFKSWRLYRYFLLCILPLFVLRFSPSILQLIAGRAPNTVQRYTAIAQHIPKEAVVLSDKQGGFPIPSFSGKLVCSHHALAFVPDHEERREQVHRFFEQRTGEHKRKQILEKYAVSHVLLNDRYFDFVFPQIPTSLEILNRLRGLVGLPRIYSASETMNMVMTRDLEEVRSYLEGIGEVIAKGEDWTLFLVDKYEDQRAKSKNQ